jgi:hypothetical protein
VEVQKAIEAARKIWANSAKFLEEFTVVELAAIALSQNPTVASLRLLLTAWHTEVWSDDHRITSGMDILVSEGLITSERKNQILINPS